MKLRSPYPFSCKFCSSLLSPLPLKKTLKVFHLHSANWLVSNLNLVPGVVFDTTPDLAHLIALCPLIHALLCRAIFPAVAMPTAAQALLIYAGQLSLKLHLVSYPRLGWPVLRLSKEVPEIGRHSIILMQLLSCSRSRS